MIYYKDFTIRSVKGKMDATINAFAYYWASTILFKDSRCRLKKAANVRTERKDRKNERPSGKT